MFAVSKNGTLNDVSSEAINGRGLDKPIIQASNKPYSTTTRAYQVFEHPCSDLVETEGGLGAADEQLLGDCLYVHRNTLRRIRIERAKLRDISSVKMITGFPQSLIKMQVSG
ncbi:hypothetical protein BG003_006964 [Podila horticola]|nr:hypothetical protein BG003_006964 [Podila horticola]